MAYLNEINQGQVKSYGGDKITKTADKFEELTGRAPNVFTKIEIESTNK